MDGGYDSDPRKNSNAVRFAYLPYMVTMNRCLGVMDSTAVSLFMETNS